MYGFVISDVTLAKGMIINQIFVPMGNMHLEVSFLVLEYLLHTSSGV